MRESALGKIISKEQRKKQSIRQEGKHHSPKTEFKKGIIPWNKGLGNNSDLRRQRSSKECIEWRTLVFKRDEYKCLMPGCNQSEKYLEAHHIRPFSQYKKLRFDIKNGITLCKDCHKKVKNKENRFENMFDAILEGMEFF